MNGIKAMFGEIGRIYLLMFTATFLYLQSCVGKSSNTCDWERVNYEEQWDFEVSSVYRYKKFKATYIIESTNGKKIFFRPIQDIVSSAKSGDRIVKDKNSKFAYLINKDGDSLKSRIFSIGCDSLVGR